MSRRLPAWTLAALACAVLAACGGTRRALPDDDERLESRRAVHEAHEELPGTVLSRRRIVLDGELRITLAAPDQPSAEAALGAAFAVADSVNRLINVNLPGNEIGGVNAAAGKGPVTLSPWTAAMLAAALDWAARTGGAFDPTVGPLTQAWGLGGARIAVPTNETLEAARAHVGWRKVRFDPAARTVALEAGMQLDMRGVGKGFVLDRIREAMIAAGATSGIADFEGDLVFFGPGTESSRNLWPIEIADPYDPRHAMARLELPPGALSTSAALDRVIEIEGETYGHLLDPRTGWPPRGLSSVTVYAPSALEADLLSTALFILGLQDGLRLVAPLHNVEAMFVTDAEPGRNSRVETTAGLRRYLKRLERPLRPAPQDLE